MTLYQSFYRFHYRNLPYHQAQSSVVSSFYMTMLVIITGGGGFLGQCLADELLKREALEVDGQVQRIATITLADIRFGNLQPSLAQSNIITQAEGDVSNVSYCEGLFQDYDCVSVFHLGAVMSGDGEDLCLRVNLQGTWNMLNAARSWGERKGKKATFIMTSAGATIGSGAPTDYVQKDDSISDSSRATPHTTYGCTKACAELLLSDYGRRGLVETRALRLPTIVVRAGAPNAATTSCFSSVVREPLNGVDVVLPIASHVRHAVTGKRHAIQALVQLHNATPQQIQETLGFDRTVFLPAVALSLGNLQEALYQVASDVHKLGKITYQVDEKLSAVVGSFPTQIQADRAMELGISGAPNPITLVREYMEDFPGACQGLTPRQEIPPVEPQSDSRVAVITGAGSGIGRAVALRLSQGGWRVALAGRRQQPLQETAKLLKGYSIVVPTNVVDKHQVEELFAVTKQRFGRVDLLFNNAGINCPAARIDQIDPNDFDKVLQTNLRGPFLCAQTAMRYMSEGGRIINNGSISAHVPRPGSAPYTCAKHAVLGLTKCIALDGRSLNVACGQVDFGNVESALSRATNTAGQGAMQANGTLLEEPQMDMEDAAESVWTMANLPLTANILQMTIMATKMPFVGRG